MLIELLVDGTHYGTCDASAVPDVGERIWAGDWMIVARREWSTSKGRVHTDEVRLSVGIHLERADTT